MGNIIRSLASGFGNVVGDLFGAPLDFLSGKSCGSACGSTWDLICYIEHFCVTNLLKLVAVLFLFYVGEYTNLIISYPSPAAFKIENTWFFLICESHAVLLFFYFLHKIGICGCLGRGMCKMAWASLSSCFSACEYTFMFTRIKLKNLRRRREAHMEEDIEDFFSSSTTSDELMNERMGYTHMPGTSVRSLSMMRSRERRRVHRERSLRTRSHRLRLGLRRGPVYVGESHSRKHGRRVKTVHDIRVTRTSKFVRKASANRFGHRRW